MGAIKDFSDMLDRIPIWRRVGETEMWACEACSYHEPRRVRRTVLDL